MTKEEEGVAPGWSQRCRDICQDVALYMILFTAPVGYVWSATWAAYYLHDPFWYQGVCGWWNVALMGYLTVEPLRTIHGRSIAATMKVTKKAWPCTKRALSRWTDSDDLMAPAMVWFAVGIGWVAVETLVTWRTHTVGYGWTVLTSTGSSLYVGGLLVMLWWMGYRVQTQRPLVQSRDPPDRRQVCPVPLLNPTDCGCGKPPDELLRQGRDTKDDGCPWIVLHKDNKPPFDVMVDAEQTLANIGGTLVVRQRTHQPQTDDDAPFDEQDDVARRLLMALEPSSSIEETTVHIRYDLQDRYTCKLRVVFGCVLTTLVFTPWIYLISRSAANTEDDTEDDVVSLADIATVTILYLVLLTSFLTFLVITYHRGTSTRKRKSQTAHMSSLSSVVYEQGDASLSADSGAHSYWSIGGLNMFAWACLLVSVGCGPWFTMTFNLIVKTATSNPLLADLWLFVLYGAFLLMSRVSNWALASSLENATAPYMHSRFVYFQQIWNYVCQFAIFGFPTTPLSWQFVVLMVMSFVHQLCIFGHAYRWMWHTFLIITHVRCGCTCGCCDVPLHVLEDDQDVLHTNRSMGFRSSATRRRNMATQSHAVLREQGEQRRLQSLAGVILSNVGKGHQAAVSSSTADVTVVVVESVPGVTPCSAAQLFESILVNLHEMQTYLQDTVACLQSFVALSLLIYIFRVSGFNANFTSRFVTQDFDLATVVVAQVVVRLVTWFICFQVLRLRLRRVMSPAHVQLWCTYNAQTGMYCLLDEYLQYELQLVPGSALFVLIKQAYEDEYPHLFRPLSSASASASASTNELSGQVTEFLLYWYRWFPAAIVRKNFGYTVAASCLIYSFIFLNHISCPVRYYALPLISSDASALCGLGV